MTLQLHSYSASLSFFARKVVPGLEQEWAIKQSSEIKTERKNMRGRWGLEESPILWWREEGWGLTGSQTNTPLLWHCQRAAHPKQTRDTSKPTKTKGHIRTLLKKNPSERRLIARTHPLVPSWFGPLSVLCLEVDNKIVSYPATVLHT